MIEISIVYLYIFPELSIRILTLLKDMLFPIGIAIYIGFLIPRIISFELFKNNYYKFINNFNIAFKVEKNNKKSKSLKRHKDLTYIFVSNILNSKPFKSIIDKTTPVKYIRTVKVSEKDKEITSKLFRFSIDLAAMGHIKESRKLYRISHDIHKLIHWKRSYVLKKGEECNNNQFSGKLHNLQMKAYKIKPNYKTIFFGKNKKKVMFELERSSKKAKLMSTKKEIEEWRKDHGYKD